jgi:hypothetical protein
MKSKQLANVLIKLLGLSALAHGIPSFVQGFLIGLSSAGRAGGSSISGNQWIYATGSVVGMILALLLIAKSRCIAEFLFKGEDE